MKLNIKQADLDNAGHASAIIDLLNNYARDRFGGGEELSELTKRNLIPELQRHPTTLILLAFLEQHAVGMATCFVGFSTFNAKPLLNIHDLIVDVDHRGHGIGRALLESAEHAAKRIGCCKLTLEVVDGNATARGLYESFGFTDQQLGEFKLTRFMHKPFR